MVQNNKKTETDSLSYSQYLKMWEVDSPAVMKRYCSSYMKSVPLLYHVKLPGSLTICLKCDEFFTSWQVYRHGDRSPANDAFPNDEHKDY